MRFCIAVVGKFYELYMLRNSINLFIAFVLFMTSACFAPCIKAEESTTVTVVGVSESFEDKARARDEAFRDAYRRAIEKGVGINIKSGTDMENRVVIMDVVRTRTDGFVKKWKIDDEGTGPGGLYYLTITAEVVKGQLTEDDKDALTLVINLMGNPRFIVTIEETNLGKKPAFSKLEAILTETLTNYGYLSIDSKQKKLIDESKELGKPKRIDNASFRDIAMQMQVDVIIVGKIYTEGLPKNKYFHGTNWVSTKAYCSVSAIIVETGEILEIQSSQCVGTGLTQLDAGEDAIGKCGNKIASKLIWNIPQHIGVTQERTVQLVINGLSYSEYLTLGDQLENMRTVFSVFPKGWKNGGFAHFDIKTTGNENNLAKRLHRHNFKIIKSNMNKIELQKMENETLWDW